MTFPKSDTSLSLSFYFSFYFSIFLLLSKTIWADDSLVFFLSSFVLFVFFYHFSPKDHVQPTMFSLSFFLVVRRFRCFWFVFVCLFPFSNSFVFSLSTIKKKFGPTLTSSTCHTMFFLCKYVICIRLFVHSPRSFIYRSMWNITEL